MQAGIEIESVQMDGMLFRGQTVKKRFFAAEFKEGRDKSQNARGSPDSGSARSDFDLKTFFGYLTLRSVFARVNFSFCF